MEGVREGGRKKDVGKRGWMEAEAEAVEVCGGRCGCSVWS